MLEYRTGVLDAAAEVGDRLIAGGIGEGAIAEGSRWKFAAGPDESGDGSEWIWKLIQRTPKYLPTWVVDGPAVDVNEEWSTRLRFWACLKDAQQTARQFAMSHYTDMQKSHAEPALFAAQASSLWDEIEEWLDSVELFTRHRVEA
jgi:hypothetical protein